MQQKCGNNKSYEQKMEQDGGGKSSNQPREGGSNSKLGLLAGL